MPQQRQIDVFVFENVNLLDISGPVQAFHSASAPDHVFYTHRFISPDGKNVRTSCGMEIVAQGSIQNINPVADLLIPGGDGIDAFLEDREISTAIRAFASQTKNQRLISICSGALLLAAAGVLDGRRATTHWSRAQIVKSRYPRVLWELDTIYTKSDRIYTSAGVSTGIDLALAIIEEDCGRTLSLEVAQELVVYLKRSGGQRQFSQLLQAQQQAEPDLIKLIDKISGNPAYNWTLSELAKASNMSPRTLDRKFNQSLGISPVQFVELTRLEQAKILLAKGRSMKQVASLCGFGDLQKMRRCFSRHLGVTTSEYLQHFGRE
ncbi:DJ-1/PfpI family protein [Kiloniella laminariae]|uniref:DJ-1/PfpI family protein n=1 Tax=Kiloniella laminariae TaxID=454162 RepID=A0ABT4LMQ1_9PROT|nr:DJ-1/PfpI family protein [Kiloniella laminariae]MCZ4282413.1 DJ-1/PfpI family protein [Kiloniella laminariae]